MGLDDFEAEPCRSDADCVAAAQRDASPCARYACSEGVCARLEAELCNGEDDDCDGWIDEGLTPMSSRRGRLAPETAERSPSAAIERHTGTAYWLIPGENEEDWIIQAAGTSGSARLEFASSAGEGGSCPTEHAPLRCRFSEIAMAADTQHLVYALVNQAGCVEGQLRVGISDRENSPSAVWLGKTDDADTEEESNIAFGVALEDNCSAGPRELSPSGRGSLQGATRPAAASLDTGSGKVGGLVLWLAHPSAPPIASNACGERDEIAVQALGVYVRQGERGWLDGTDGGQPQVLGWTSALSAPALIALPSTSSYLAAFASEQAGERGVQLVSVSPHDHRLVPEGGSFFADASAEQVVLALASGDSVEPQVGLAWTSCAATPGLRLLVLSDSGHGEREPLVIEAEGPPENPRLIHVTRGFSVVAPAGGWVLLWDEPSDGNTRDTKFARIADDGTLFDRGTLAASSGVYPVAYPNADSEFQYLRVRGIDGSSEVELSGRWCDDID